MADEAEPVIAEGMELAAARGTDGPLYGGFVQALGRLALLRKDWPKAEELLTRALTLIERGGEPARGDLAAAYFNLGTAYVAQRRYQLAADAYQQARDLDAAIYGPDHGELVTDEFRLAEARGAAGDMNAAYEAINRCLAIIRQGHPQGRRWRADVLSAAVVIDLELGRAPSGDYEP
jgi:tetratricopeptide (TPR) repeat protein